MVLDKLESNHLIDQTEADNARDSTTMALLFTLYSGQEAQSDRSPAGGTPGGSPIGAQRQTPSYP